MLTHKPNTNEEYPIYIRLTKDRAIANMTTGVFCSAINWDKIKLKVKSGDKRAIYKNERITQFLTRLEEFHRHLDTKKRDEITVGDFKKSFLALDTNFGVKAEFFNLVDLHYKNLMEIGKVSTARNFRDTRNCVSKFTKDKTIFLKNIDYDWLSKLEHQMKKEGNKNSTISNRMRDIRNIYYRAIKQDLIGEDKNPFKRYVIPAAEKTKKRAISFEDIVKIFKFDITDYPELELSKDTFILSYGLGGMNFTDLIQLKYSNFEGEKVIYTRSKTKKEMYAYPLSEVFPIIEKYKQLRTKTNYILPILMSEDLTPTQFDNRKMKMLGRFNRDMKEIAKLCGIESNITSYVCRHSFASNLKKKGVRIDIISQFLAHESTEVTKIYLNDFDDEEMVNSKNVLNLNEG